MMFVMAVKRAALLVERPERAIAPAVETEYCETVLPISKVFAPEIEMERETLASGCTAASRSAHRPPQPVIGGRSGMEVCHCMTWSEWEKSWGGLANPPDWYFARVRG